MALASKTCMILETSLIAPQNNGSNNIEQTLALTFMDLDWVHFFPMKCILFYELPCSKPQFLETIVPRFKTSLANTLKHYLPLSGNLYYPTGDNTENIPEIRYKPGDSVTLTVAEYSSGETNSDEHFKYLIGNDQKDCEDFYAFFPELPHPKTEPEFLSIPLFSVQITLFPGVGLCLGFTSHHVLGDASSIMGFKKVWGKVSKLGTDDGIQPPFYDRSMVKDPRGFANTIWNMMKKRKYQYKSAKNLPTNKVRATYILQESDIKKLKSMVKSKKPDLAHLSSFTVTTAYVWTSLTKSAIEAEEEVHDDDEEHLLIPVDARSRFDPPLPETYFGNGLGAAFTETTHGNLKGEEGFFNAVELISNLIINTVNKKGELFKYADHMKEKFISLAGKRLLSISGSPKFDLYDVDFGWGKPKKFENMSINGNRAISICKSGEFEGGLEICLALPKMKMDAFARCFYGGLKELNL